MQLYTYPTQYGVHDARVCICLNKIGNDRLPQNKRIRKHLFILYRL